MLSIHLTLMTFGAFVLDNQGEVISKHLIYPDVDLSVSELTKTGRGETTEIIKAVAQNILKLGIDTLIVENDMLKRALPSLEGVSVKVEKSKTCEWFRQNIDHYLLDNEIVESAKAALEFRRAVGLRMAKAEVSIASKERDLLVKNAIDGIDEIDKAINMLTMRAKEWYSLHHPSLGEKVEDQEIYIQILQDCIGKSQITEDCLHVVGVDDSTSKQIMAAIPEDIGAELEQEDLTVIHDLITGITKLYDVRKLLEEYVTSLMMLVAPNITALAGSLVGARLISLAGSLKDLARKPSSTIQILGAEKALFRSLKTGTDPPKHGVIYQVSEVHAAPYWQRGKIARALAGKLSIAAKVDGYSKRNIGENLKADFSKRVEEIKIQSAEPPPDKPSRRIKKTPQHRVSRKKRGKSKKRRKGGGK